MLYLLCFSQILNHLNTQCRFRQVAELLQCDVGDVFEYLWDVVQLDLLAQIDLFVVNPHEIVLN